MTTTTINRRLRLMTVFASLAFSANTLAQETAAAEDFTLTGSITGISQYRLRGVSFSDEDPAIQGGLTLAHKSGFYVGAWTSNLAGYGTFGGANLELDAIGGYSAKAGDTTLDGGLVWYSFPGTNGHGYAEIYGSATHPVGPADFKLGLNYAPKRQAIGDADNLYTYAELALPIEGTPVTLKGHVGYTTGKGSIYAGPTGHYLDYSAGAEITHGKFTLGLSYVGTNISRSQADDYYTVADGKAGHQLVDGAFLVSLSAAF
jgi:uncharacterized protein (TIGR02001 family)